MNKYAGIGARKTPHDVLTLMHHGAATLAQQGYCLRSGGAPGADSAFEQGCDSQNGTKDIYLPWRKFNNSDSPLYIVSAAAIDIAKYVYGPRWQFLSNTTRQLMARNCYQILGLQLNDPVDFVVCWTPDGCTSSATRSVRSGGTGQAIALASDLGIPVYNLNTKVGMQEFVNIYLQLFIYE